MATPSQVPFRFQRLMQIVGIWTLIGIFITFYDYFLLKSNLSSGMGPSYSFWASLGLNMFAGFTGGILGGIVLEKYNQLYRSRPYLNGILVVTLLYMMIVLLITILVSVVPALVLFDNPIHNPEAIAYMKSWLLDIMHLKNLLFWASVVVLTQFTIQVSDKFGPKNLWRILTGQYHKPIKEERVFMFLDLKSSTTIAEKLGEEIYHEFLKDLFADITNPIIRNQAEIYQYVGDEVVINWKIKHQQIRGNFMNCFFDIQQELLNRRDKYIGKYDIMPQFKAGAHLGQVIAGEVGIIKRDITYSGDVLNTTARIQGKCNELNASFLISNSLKDFLSNISPVYQLESKGFISLRGKSKQVELIAVERE